jgi:hypothetical protein
VDGFEVALAGVLVAVTFLDALASRIGIPNPIVLVIGGLARSSGLVGQDRSIGISASLPSRARTVSVSDFHAAGSRGASHVVPVQ